MRTLTLATLFLLLTLMIVTSGCVAPPEQKQELDYNWKQKPDRSGLHPSDPLYYTK